MPIKKDTSLRKAILQAAITGKLLTGGESLPLAPKPSRSMNRPASSADSLRFVGFSATPSPKGASPLKIPQLDSREFSPENPVSGGTSRPTPPFETGKQLLARIIEDRNKKLLAQWQEALKKNPKAKKPAPIVASQIEEDEIPFEIPENWCWCRLGDLVNILGDGLHGTPQYDVSGEYFFVNGNNLNNGVIEIKPDTKKVNKKEFEKYKKELNSSTILVSINGTIGNIAFYNNEKIILGKSACYFNVALEDMKKYFFYLFQTDFFLTYAMDNATGTTIKNVGLGTMRNFLIPLPPLSVQNAIVAKLEQVLPLVDAYENALLAKEELKSALPQSLKKAILQEAVQGKLTEKWRQERAASFENQNSVSERSERQTGTQLLDRIIKERNVKALAQWQEALKTNPKAKKPAPIVASKIEEDEIPFEIPEDWCWVRGTDIFAPMESIKPQCDNFVYIDTDAVNNQLNIIDNPKFLLSKQAPSRASRKLHNGDVLFSMVRPYLKNIAYVDEKYSTAIASTGFYVMTQIGMYNPKYLYYAVLSPYVIDGLHKFMKGDNSPSINTTDIDNFIYPLPPLAEQEAIVAKLEEVLPITID